MWVGPCAAAMAAKRIADVRQRFDHLLYLLVDEMLRMYHIVYMYAVRTTDEFDGWLKALRDMQARARIAVRIRRIEEGNLGDHKAVGDGVSELRFAFGPGYRVYFTQREGAIVFLLCGGDKDSHSSAMSSAQRNWQRRSNDGPRNEAVRRHGISR